MGERIKKLLSKLDVNAFYFIIIEGLIQLEDSEKSESEAICRYLITVAPFLKEMGNVGIFPNECYDPEGKNLTETMISILNGVKKAEEYYHKTKTILTKDTN